MFNHDFDTVTIDFGLSRIGVATWDLQDAYHKVGSNLGVQDILRDEMFITAAQLWLEKALKLCAKTALIFYDSRSHFQMTTKSSIDLWCERRTSFVGNKKITGSSVFV